ncbi:MAG TPA: hypothetical protein VFD92_01215 [Candidatus Binatia bacterium]|nr:hypothetical protein [Candidatus Binatia bacterium]
MKLATGVPTRVSAREARRFGEPRATAGRSAATASRTEDGLR